MPPQRPAAPDIVDLGDPALWQDPSRGLAPAREAAPIARTTRGEAVVLRHAETERLMADPRMRTLGTRLLEGLGVDSGPLADWWRLVMFNTNPPEHGRLRGLVSRAFTPRRVDALRPRVRGLAESLVDPLLGAGAIDYEAALADALPIRVTCELLGVPPALWSTVADATTEIGRVFTTRLDAGQRARSEAAIETLSTLLDELLDARGRTPTDDLLTALVAARDEEDRLSRAECRAMAINLLFAGHDTTRGLLAIGLGTLLANPDAFAALRARPDATATAVEEMLRFESPTFGSLRAAADTIEGEGYAIEAGQAVHFLFPGGNRDPRAFDEPDRFDPFRRGARPLSFGLGPHFCLGAGLARMEAQETLSVLLERTGRIELGAAPRFEPYATIRRYSDGLVCRLEAS